MMLEKIDGRQLQFQPYGIAITKTTARRKGFNPIWYSDNTPGRTWPITAVNTMVEDALRAATGPDGTVDAQKLSDSPMFPLFKITPFFEQMEPIRSARKEFWWEREWRRVGDFRVRPRRVVAVLVPEEDPTEFARRAGKDKPGVRTPDPGSRWG